MSTLEIVLTVIGLVIAVVILAVVVAGRIAAAGIDGARQSRERKDDIE